MAKTRFTSPVGRLVQGTVDEPQTKDAQGALRVVKTGPNAGQPNPQFFIGVAFAKTDPAFNEFYGLLMTQAATDFPNLFPQGPGGQCVHPQFATKVIDGDGLDTSGKSNATKEGFAGHWVVRFASSYPPRCFYKDRYAANEQIQEKGVIKRGYFVRVNGTVEGNANAQRPGIYVNLDMVELYAYGPEIVSGPDAADAFGGAAPAMPAGASAVPVTPPVAPVAQPGFTPPVAPVAMPPVAPVAPAFAPPAIAPVAPVVAMPSPVVASPAPVSPVTPYTGYMGNGPAPVVAAPPPPLSAPPAMVSPTSRVMLPASNGATYEAMIAAGWTDDTLRAHGMMQ